MEPFDHPADPRRADVRVEFGVARAEVSHCAINRLTAEQWASFADVLDEARRSPEVFVDPLLPMRPAERVEFAERAAAADLAVRLGMSESAVRSQASDSETLRGRLPLLWARFRDGEVSPANARVAADLVRLLPVDAGVDAIFDARLGEIAEQAPVRFRQRARVLRERLHAIPLVERARAARATRGVWIDNEIDGMAYLSMKLPADDAHAAFARIDAAARSISGAAGEQRTLAQARADVATDLLLGSTGGRRAPHVTVAVTVPVMTLLGVGDEPATLDGYGPIDAETARRLAAHAPSFTRLLTHPVSGALLDIDRTSYRPPADLKRWLEVTDQLCSFPGCGRKARNSDLDHTVDRQFGGRTRASNLAHLCRHHHRLKHHTRWNVRAAHTKDRRRVVWTSPTGYRRDSDPPPF
jgi:hypothetical protein